MIRGVIFDMDGIMVDTERLFIDKWCEIMREKNMEEHREVVIHCIGLDHKLTRQHVSDCLGADFDYMDIMGEINRRSVLHCAEHGIPVKPGLIELLDKLDEWEIPYAVATSTKQDNARKRLEGIGVLERLHGLVTGDMVEKGKPEPEIFLRAAEMLGIPAEDCIVLEDSPHGILAAKRAGCRPVMIPDLKEPDEETAKLYWKQLQHLGQVIDLIQKENYG